MRTAKRSAYFVAVSSLILSVGAVAQQPLMPSAGREFPVALVQIGDVPVAIPQDWIDSKSVFIHLSNSSFISFPDVHRRPLPRSAHFELPRLHVLGIVEPATGLPERNLRGLIAELDKRRPERTLDEFGFWLWKTREYVLVDMPYPRPLDQPLIVSCLPSPRRPKIERMCTVRFYWTWATSVDYTFFDSDYPQSRCAELDQRVLELLKFLDGREVRPAPKFVR